jgi:UDP-N-acetylglucosamine transferase subunit ALG13
MILLTVGTQFPFDRMVRAVDDWADQEGRRDIVAQIGPAEYTPRNLSFSEFYSPRELRDLQEQSSVIVAHAGMGSILTALELGKPIIIMPRDHERGEHRNGHQLATARRFEHVEGVHVANDEVELVTQLRRLDDLIGSVSMTPVSTVAPDSFINALRSHLASAFA